MPTDPATHFRVRLTVGLRREGGQWTVVHEHHSVRAPDDLGRARACASPPRSALANGPPVLRLPGPRELWCDDRRRERP